jgi:hypothetical protein
MFYGSHVIHYGLSPLRVQVYIIRNSFITGYLQLLSTVNEFEVKKIRPKSYVLFSFMTSDLSNFENELYWDEREVVSRTVIKVQMNRVDSVSRSSGSLHFEVKKKRYTRTTPGGQKMILKV